MHRAFYTKNNLTLDEIIIDDQAQVHHLRNVLRLKPKEKIEASDREGNLYRCAVKKIFPDKIILEIKEKAVFPDGGKMRLSVACALPKQAKFDEIVAKLTQLGVARIIPLVTERVVVKLDKNKSLSRQARWKKIALSAVKQSKRRDIPQIDAPVEFKEALRGSAEYDLKIIPHLEGRRKTLKAILSESHPQNILVFIGPEGDFTPEEVNLALAAGCIPVSLGENVLRVDTAAIAVASFLRLYEDD